MERRWLRPGPPITGALAGRAAAAVFIVLVVTTGRVTGAAAAAYPSNQVTYTASNPTSGPFDGEVLPVSGYYTAPDGSAGQGVDVLECPSTDVPADGQPLNRTMCDPNNIAHAGMPDATTHQFSTYLGFDVQFTSAAGGVDCSVSGKCDVVADATPPGDVAAMTPVKGNDACNGAFQGSPAGSLSKSTSPPGGTGSTPAGNLPVVARGQTVTATLSWNTSDFSGTTNMASDCVTENGASDATLTQMAKPGATPTSGSTSYVSSYTIPASLPDGTVVCDRGRVSGTPTSGNPSTQKSNVVCFQVVGAIALPEGGNGVAIFGVPLLGTIGLGGKLTLRRRRVARSASR